MQIVSSKCTYEIFGSTWNSVSNIYYACLIHQIAINDEIDAFMGSFKFRLDLYRQIVGIPMGTNCAPLVADLFLFCYERDFMTTLSDVKQAEIIDAFKSTSRYLDDLLNIDNPYFEGMVNRTYPPELQLNKANTSDTEAPFLDLHLSISNGFVSV